MKPQRDLLTATLLLAACGGADVRPDNPLLDGTGIVAMELALDQTIISDQDGDGTVMVQVFAAGSPDDATAPARVALVIDTSGSMEGNKIENARDAAHAFIDRMNPRDELTLVTFGDSANPLLRNHRMNSAGRRAAAHEAIDEIEADGNTCTSCGLQSGYDHLLGGSRDGVHRVILLSDGHANRGITEPTSLAQMAQNAHQGLGIDTSAIGLGRLHNEVTLASLAQAGAADYRFLHNSDYLAELLDEELTSLHATTVRALQVALRPGDGVHFLSTQNLGARYSGDEIIFDVGQLAAGETMEFLVELQLPPGEMGRAVTATATFQDAIGRSYEVVEDARMRRSTDLAAIEDSINSKVVETRTLLLSALKIEEAMNYIASGNRKAGLEVLQSNAQELRQSAPSVALDEEVAQMEAMIQTFDTHGAGVAATAAPAPDANVYEDDADRGNVILYRAQSNERRRGTPRSRVRHAPEAYDMAEIE